MNINGNNPKPSLPIEKALEYIARGWPVIPVHSFADGCCTCGKQDCSSPAKHPMTLHGSLDATTDPEIVRRWSKETNGRANIGITTGQGSGKVAMDVDAQKGGLSTLADLERTHGKMSETPTARTGGGGLHKYFRYPPGMEIGNRNGLFPGIDIRGNGGYVLAPPSLHVSGNQYEWIIPPDKPLAEMPPWLLAAILGKPDDGTPRSMAGIGSNQSKILKVQEGLGDLHTHPGTDAGQRNETLARLVGVHVARGESQEELLLPALAWAERCLPPLPTAEVRRTIDSIVKKAERGALIVRSQGETEFEALAMPEQPTWPALATAAYHGLVGEIVSMIEPHSEADPMAILLSMLVCFGNAVGRGPHYVVEGDIHHTNLFAVAVGQSSHGRKGTSLGRTLKTFEMADAKWAKKCITGGLSSGEGLIWAVRDPIESFEPVRKKSEILGYQSVIRDHGVNDKRLLVAESEFAQALRVLRREGNTLSPIIRGAWDKGDLKTLTKNSPAQATNAHVSILGHITRPELNQYLSQTDLWNGFANRFLWALVRRSKFLPDGGVELDLQPLQQRVAAAVATASQIKRLTRSPAAQALWRSLYIGLTANRSGLYGAATGRAEAQTLRLSLIYALLDGSAVIDVRHLEAAHAVWQYCDASAAIIFGEAEHDPVQEILLDAIRSNPGINRKGLYKATGGHRPATALLKALTALRDQGVVRYEVIRTGGRPAERWFPAAHDCGDQSDMAAPAVAALVPHPNGDGRGGHESPSNPISSDGAEHSLVPALPPNPGDTADDPPTAVVPTDPAPPALPVLATKTNGSMTMEEFEAKLNAATDAAVYPDT